MTDHIHLIISKSDTQGSLSEIIRDFKKYTAKQIVNELLINNNSSSNYLYFFTEEASKIKRNKKYKVWQDGSHPILLDTNFLMDQKVEYIHLNPVKANLSSAPEEYQWSSAGDYYLNKKGMLKLELIG
jgi:REP element-mobilizing transposase RayT